MSIKMACKLTSLTGTPEPRYTPPIYEAQGKETKSLPVHKLSLQHAFLSLGSPTSVTSLY